MTIKCDVGFKVSSENRKGYRKKNPLKQTGEIQTRSYFTYYIVLILISYS